MNAVWTITSSGDRPRLVQAQLNRAMIGWIMPSRHPTFLQTSGTSEAPSSRLFEDRDLAKARSVRTCQLSSSITMYLQLVALRNLSTCFADQCSCYYNISSAADYSRLNIPHRGPYVKSIIPIEKVPAPHLHV